MVRQPECHGEEMDGQQEQREQQIAQQPDRGRAEGTGHMAALKRVSPYSRIPRS